MSSTAPRRCCGRARTCPPRPGSTTTSSVAPRTSRWTGRSRRRGDLLETHDLWRRVNSTGLIDFTEPVGLLIVAVLHFIKDEREPQQAVEFLRSKLAPGSYLVLSHASGEGLSAGQQTAAERVRSDYETQAANPGVFRRRDAIAEFFGGWPLVPPGLVWTPEWHDE